MSRQPIPRWVRQALLRKQRHTCQLCGVNSIVSTIEIDHIIPIALGGTNRFENLQLLCRRCNRSKGSRIVTRR
jgi:5-methylcytosine-specific restriction protein A